LLSQDRTCGSLDTPTTLWSSPMATSSVVGSGALLECFSRNYSQCRFLGVSTLRVNLRAPAG
jgi:hypothetical protein